MVEERNMILRWKNFVQETHGIALVWAAILMVMLLGFCGLAIDIGHYVLVKNQLQRAADAGALAGVRALFPADMKTAIGLSPDCANALTVGTQAAHWNQTDQATTVVADIKTGHWDPVTRTFDEGCSATNATFTNAVKITTHREDTPLFFGQILGVVPKTIQATSVAAKLPVAGLKEGGGFPVTINKKYFTLRTNGLKIYVNDDTNPVDQKDPTTGNDLGDTGCFFLPALPDGTPPSNFAGTIQSIILGTQEMSAVKQFDTIYLNNGAITTAINYINAKLNTYGSWTVYLPVVNEVQFNQTDVVQEFCGFNITATGKDNGKHYILGDVLDLCDAPPEVVDNSVGQDYTSLLKPAQLVY
jgi:Flp pilus assembly protein TadG